MRQTALARRRWRLLASAALAAIGVTASATVVAGAEVSQAAPAAQAQTSPIPLFGRGWGHGRGMGQYGALGYATMFGWSAAQILNHFYGGTAAGTVPSGTIMVRLEGWNGAPLRVTSGVDFVVAGIPVAAGRAATISVDANSQYQISVTPSCSSGEVLGTAAGTGQVLVRSSVADPGNDVARMLTACGPTSARSYRGDLMVLFADGLTRTVNHVAVEQYLRGVVPRESPSSWPAAPLQAQAVAARSYALAENRFPYAQTCDTTACQVYGGAGLDGTHIEAASTDSAIAATANQVRRFPSGQIARTEFSSSTGGYTAGGTFPAVVDEGDAVASNPRHRWSTSVSPTALAQRYGLGSFVALSFTARNGLGDWGGRVLSVRVIGTERSVALTGAAFQSDWGLFSTWFSTNLADGPSATSWGAGRVDVFTKGLEGGLWHRVETAGGLGAWSSLGGVLTSDPDATVTGADRLAVVTRGTDGALWHRSLTGTSWGQWTSLGGLLSSGPTVVSSGSNRLDVFARGIDGALWQRSFNGTWGPWQSLGGLITSDPDVSSWGSGRLDVFARGVDGNLWHRAFTGATWTHWDMVPAALTSGPGVVSWGPNRIDMFVRSTDGSLWANAWTGSAWFGWYSLGGALASDPDVASQGPNRLDVVVRGVDGYHWQRTWDGGTWRPWFRID